MVVVWVLSAQSHLATDLGWIDMVLRKLAHMTEFGLLALLWARAWTWRLDRPERAGPSARAPAHVRARRDAAIVVGAAIAGAWAIVDEVHQSTVDGRVGTPVDVLIDGVGIAAAVVLWIHWPALWRRVRRRLRADPRVRASRAPRR
ncbi:MAG: VanZ family protein [Solirubrobacteraceae bacterium]|nr:VanZ family protein [Solirubrobacteraceae bacterium]